MKNRLVQSKIFRAGGDGLTAVGADRRTQIPAWPGQVMPESGGWGDALELAARSGRIEANLEAAGYEGHNLGGRAAQIAPGF